MPFLAGKSWSKTAFTITNGAKTRFGRFFIFERFLSIFDHFGDFANFFKNIDFFKILQKNRKKQ
jgi:hypothetical protein